MSKTSISTNQELRKGEYLLSTNGNYKAVFEEDGDFTIYTWFPIWSTKTNGKGGFRILLQEDNNLVMYTQVLPGVDSKPVWSSETGDLNSISNRMRLTMTDDGLLVLDRNGETIWTSAPFVDKGVGPVQIKPKHKPPKTT